MEIRHIKSFVDYISGTVELVDYDGWKYILYENTGMEFGDRIGHVTEKKLYKIETSQTLFCNDSFDYNGWNLTLIETVDKSTGEAKYKLKIQGCPAKIFNKDENHFNISLPDFKAVLENFESTFNIPLQQIKIAAPFEISGTFSLNNEINERLILFQLKRPYTAFFHTESNELLGYKADIENSHYYPKIYLPGTKYCKPLNNIRIERHYNRVATLIRDTGISTWADLLDIKYVHQCYKLVLNTWQNTIVFDLKLKVSNHYKSYLNEIIQRGYTSQFWVDVFSKSASDKTIKKRISEYNQLSFDRGEGLYLNILNAIIAEGEKFRNVTTWLTGNNKELYNTNNDIGNTVTRKCISCNKDISYQKPNSKFCSKKYVGEKHAKACRNADSNKRNNQKRKTKCNSKPVPGNIPVITESPRVTKLKELLEKSKMRYYKAG